MTFRHSHQNEGEEADYEIPQLFHEKLTKLLEIMFTKFNMELKMPTVEEDAGFDSDFISNDNLSDI